MTEPSADIEDLVRSHGREVYSILLAYCRDPATAEDLSQEVFLVAARKGVRPGQGVRFWLREVARRLSLKELHRRRPTPMAPGELPEAPAPARHPVFDERLGALRECMKGLPTEDRDLLAQRYETDESLAEIAARAKQSAGYVKQRLFRLRRKLGACIERRLKGSEAQDE